MKKVLVVLGLIALAIGAYVSSGKTANNPAAEVTVQSITSLRLTPANQYLQAFLTQYNSTTGIGSGHFVYSGSTSCTDNSGTLIQSAVNGTNTGCWARKTDGQEYDISWFGAACGGVQITDGVSTSTTTVTSASAKWGNVKSGWVAVVNGAGSGGNQLVTTVSTVNSSSSLTLATTTLTSGTGLTVSVYPDDTTAISNTVTAANSANVAVRLPAGATCGLSNPGSFSVLTLNGPGLDLNHGNLWMGQTGPVTQTGWVIAVNSNNSGVWNGTINGLYQTNQNIAQGYSGTLVFNSGSALPGYTNNFLSNLVITNTKARAFAIQDNSNTVISNVTTTNCGDLTYSAGYAGMAFCGQFENPQGSLQITNFTASGCSQSCIIIDDLSLATKDPNLSVNITNFYGKSARYYALDFEDIQGCTKIDQIHIDNTGITPSGNVVGGGIIARDITCHVQNNVRIDAPADSDIIEDSPGGFNQFVQLSNLNLLSSGTSHAGVLQVTTNGGAGAPTTFQINHILTDVFQLSTNSGVACSTSNPMQMLVSFNDLRVSHLYTGTYDTSYSQQGTSNTMFYILGRNSDLGRESISSVLNNPLASDFDFFTVWEQTITYSTISRIGRATTTWNNPMTFSCPV